MTTKKLNIKRIEEIFKHNLLLAHAKNTDYGCESLTDFGSLGLIIRMNDKMERIKHIIVNRDKGIPRRIPESVIDSARDLINYTAYLILCEEGVLLK